MSERHQAIGKRPQPRAHLGMGETFDVPARNTFFRSLQRGLQSVVVQQPVQQGIEELAAERVSKTEIDHHHVADAPGAPVVPIGQTVLTLPLDFRQMRRRPVGHSQLVKRVLVGGQAKRPAAVDGLAPRLQDRMRIAASHLRGRVLEHHRAGALQVALHAAQQVRFSVAGISGHDDVPARPHPVYEKPLDAASDVQPIEIFFRQRFGNGFPTCRGKCAPQPGAVGHRRRFRRAALPLHHSPNSPVACAAASPSGTKPSCGKAAIVGR